MVEHYGRAPVGTFFLAGALVRGATATLGEGPAHHARVKRLSTGDPVALTNGSGDVAVGQLGTLRRESVDVIIDQVQSVPRPASIHLCVPIADRDRMLWLAEKCAELGITSWQPVRFHRSSSVMPRGEGKPFATKTRARMIGALEQSHGAWLPEIRPELNVDDLGRGDGQLRILLDVHGPPLLSVVPLGARREVVVLFGPEGGIESTEMELLTSTGWRQARLAPTMLRFETAGIAAVAVLRAASLDAKEG